MSTVIRADSLPDLLRDLRAQAHLTQRELAERAGTSGPAVAHYESGRKEPRLVTLARLLDSLGWELRLTAVRKGPVLERELSRPEQRSLALHTAIAQKLDLGPARVLLKAETNLGVIATANEDGSADRYLDAWRELLAGPVSDLRDQMVARDEWGCALRSCTPFAGVLTPVERQEIFDRYRR